MSALERKQLFGTYNLKEKCADAVFTLPAVDERAQRVLECFAELIGESSKFFDIAEYYPNVVR